jgi:hypothetical protein
MEELFCGAAEEPDKQQMVNRVLGVLGWAHQPQQPVRFEMIAAFEFTVEGFQQGWGVVTAELIQQLINMNAARICCKPAVN